MPNVNVFESDNRSSYNGLMLHLQGNVSKRVNLIANYTFSKAQTWGCLLGELSTTWMAFSATIAIRRCLNAFGPGDHGPSGEDVRHPLVLARSFPFPRLRVEHLNQVRAPAHHHH